MQLNISKPFKTSNTKRPENFGFSGRFVLLLIGKSIVAGTNTLTPLVY